MPFQHVNGVVLHYESIGEGPPVLLIMGATGYGGVFERLAELLADGFTVITYDRRGNARSPPPPDWNSTSPEQQADDAAALLATLGQAPAAIFGTSSGGVFALAMLIRHPESVRAAVLHEPAFFALFEDPRDLRETLTALIRDAMETGGPRKALEQFIRFAGGDSNWESLDPRARELMLASAPTYFGVESGAFDTYLPDDEAFDGLDAPIQLLVSDASFPAFSQAARWLAERLDAGVTRTPGTHFAYLDHPDELAETLKPLLRNLDPPGANCG